MRQLRKACSMPSCSQRTGECMHCACDGRCGQHDAGVCGIRREGNGTHCKRPDCPHDTSCLHSTRATCCQCRNLVTANGRSARIKRLRQSESRTSKRHKQHYYQPFPMNDERRTLQPLERLLAEYPEWQYRRSMCNLIVMVDGIQFHLHKYPMLMESRLLHARARAFITLYASAVPVVSIPSCPGGPQVFERLCIYAYSGQMAFEVSSFAAVYCAIHFLQLGSDIKAKAQCYLTQLIQASHQCQQYNAVLDQLTQASFWFHQFPTPQGDYFIDSCIDALARGLPCTADRMNMLLDLSSDLFGRITQQMQKIQEVPVSQLEDPEMYSELKTTTCLEIFQRTIANNHEDDSRPTELDDLIEMVEPDESDPDVFMNGDSFTSSHFAECAV